MLSLTTNPLAESESWKFVATVCDGHVPIADQGFLNAALGLFSFAKRVS
jgi:hypothetical protein